MSGPLRVFVSSTMKDLVNERDAVVTELRRLNFEPVHAEAVLPTGAGSWEVIEDEIAGMRCVRAGPCQFRTDFDLARDLADKVGQAITLLLAAKFRELVDRRGARSAAPPAPAFATSLPIDLIDAVARRSALLFAGAGMSLQAGLPSAYAFTEHLLSKIRDVDPTYGRAAHGGDFNDVATDLNRLVGTHGLRVAVDQLMGVEAVVGSSASQRTAVRAFDLVLTTNYDTLLERADENSRLVVVSEEIQHDLPRAALVKLHGTMGNPESLVVTKEDLRAHGDRRRRLIAAIKHELSTRPVVVVGSSLRDPTTEELFAARTDAPLGWAVAPTFSEVDRLRLAEWNLLPIVATAETFFSSLAQKLDIDAATDE